MEIISASPKRYLRLGLLKEVLKITDNVQDEYLFKVIEQNSYVIDAIVNREFNKQKRKETKYYVKDMILLDVTPVLSVESIIADNQEISNYALFEDSGIIIFETYKCNFEKVIVTYEGGYETDEESFEIPGDIEKACLELCLYQITGDVAIKSERIGDYQVQYQDVLNIYTDVEQLLKNWQRIE